METLAVDDQLLMRAEPSELLLRAEPNDGGRSSRTLSRGAQRGDLVRLAPGTYAPAELWLLMPWHERDLLAAVAFSESRRRPVVFCGATALRLHGLPMARKAAPLDVRAAHRNHAGTRLQVSPYVNAKAASKLHDKLRQAGETQEARGKMPMLPGVRSHWNPPGDPGESVEVTVRLNDGSPLGRVRVVPLSSAMAAVFGRDPLNIGTAPADALKRCGADADDFHADRGGIRADRNSFRAADSARASTGSRASTVSAAVASLNGDSAAVETLAKEARELLRTGAERTRFDRQWAFADGLSESPGESLSRALIHELGFVVPELQRNLFDARGRKLGRVDFWWEEIRLAGEFDGLVKYSAAMASAGATGPEGQDALAKEKLREDAIRRAGNNLARWVWADVMDRRRFAALLEEFHIPRRR